MTHVSIPFSLRRYEDGAVTEVHKKVTVGRLASNDIVLHGPKSSRSHAILQVEEGRLIISDRGSTNGTYVNGVRIVGKEIVRAGDTVRFDREVFLVQGPAADWDKTEPRHPATWVLWPDVPRRGQYSTIRVLDGGEFIGIGPVQAVFLLPARRMPGMPALLHGLHGARFWGVVAVLSAMACCAALLFFLT